MDGVQLPQDYCHFKEAVYFLPLSKDFVPKTKELQWHMEIQGYKALIKIQGYNAFVSFSKLIFCLTVTVNYFYYN